MTSHFLKFCNLPHLIKNIMILVVILLIWPSQVQAAITAEAAASADTGWFTSSSVTISSFTVSGDNTLLIVGVSIRQTAGQYVSSVSYGSDNLSLVGTASNGGVVRTELWQTLNPTAGTANVVVTLNSAARFVAGVQLFTGVDQTTPLGTYGSANGNSTGPSVTVSSNLGEMVVDVVGNQYNTTPSVGSGQTLQWTDVTTSWAANNTRASSSTEAGASSVTMSWTLSTSRSWGIVAVPIKPAVAEEEDDWGYRKSITIDRTKVGVTGTSNTTLSDYPLLINIVDSDLATVENGGYVENSNGYDILFRGRDYYVCGSQPGVNSCDLSHQIEKYDPSTGALIAWVRVPSVNTNAATSDSVIYLYFGNIGIISSLEDATGVWDSDFEAVWHMSDNATTTTVAQSTSVTTPGDGVAAAKTNTKTTTGQIYGALSFDGSSDYIYQSSTSTVSNPQGYTISAWVRTGTASGHKILGFDANRTGTATGWRDRHLYIGTDGKAYAGCYNSGVYTAASTNAVNDNSWHLLTSQINDTGNMLRLYVDGALDNSTDVGGNCVDYDAYWRIGSYTLADWPAASSGYYAGDIDEVRISSTIRSSDWIMTDYNNQGSPSTFYSIGDLEESPNTLIHLISFTAENYSGLVQLKWITGYEVDNLGFRIYREDGEDLVRITPSMVAGSALLTRDQVALTSGRTYTWQDFVGSSPGPLHYWLEDVDTHGKSTWHGLVTAVNNKSELPQQVRSVVLSYLGQGASKIRSDGYQWNHLGNWAPKIQIPAVSALRSVQGSNPPDMMTIDEARLLNRLRLEGEEKLSWNSPIWQDLTSINAVKIHVKKEGWYRVTQPELVQAGLSDLTDPRYLQLYADGVEIPMIIPTREANEDRVRGRYNFEEEDWIEFYGTGVDTPWTDTKVYWLVEGTKPGKRVTKIGGSSGRRNVRSLKASIVLDPKIIYWAGKQNGDKENFFGSVVTVAGVDEILQLKHLDLLTSKNGQIKVDLQGVTEKIHMVQVEVNGVNVGSLVFEGQRLGTDIFTLPSGLLTSGRNIISLISQNGEDDISLVDYIGVTYWRTPDAEEDVLKMTLEAGQVVTIGGFTTPTIRSMDVTDPRTVREVTGAITLNETGYAITVSIPGHGIKELLVFADTQIQAAAAVTMNHPSAWRKEVAGADVVIISHGDFIESLQPLKMQQQVEGYTVALVDVEDLYDEFNYGEKTPYALKDFLTKARSDWENTPRFLLLVGDASFDPRNYLGLGDFDYVPTKQVSTGLLETSSDDWYADSNDDGIPEIAVGRISARSAEDMAIQVEKIVAYKQGSVTGSGESWENRLVLVADINEGFDFETVSNQLSELTPSSMSVLKIYRGELDDATARDWVLQSLNDGALIMNYFGHGSVETWGGNMLTSSDPPELMNGTKLPIVISMNCLNGFFNDIYTESLAEALMKAPNGGSVSVWASSGLGSPLAQDTMNKEFFRQLFNYDQAVGEAVMKAKAAICDQNVRKTWILFGDPTIRLGNRLFQNR